MSFDSVRGKVLAALIARFQAMTVAGGYHYDIQAASVVSDPVNILTVPAALLPFILVEPSPSTRVYQPASLVMIDAEFLVTFRLMADGTDPTRKAQAGENFFQDLERAIASNFTLGGLVIDTRVQEPDGPMVGMGDNNNVFGILKLKTQYIRPYGTP